MLRSRYIAWHGEQLAEAGIERLRHLADRLGIKKPLKTIYRRLLGDPVGSPDISPRG